MLETHLVSPYQMSPPSCTHRVNMVPSAGWGREMWHSGRAGSGAGSHSVIVEETEESGSEDSKEIASNMS
ncbi:hypothetical protein JCGZ_22184 [Jatropha curcas]|uniref:Uncharacterized protein n=1 Tax=Jatropha curcas TaxID=180498 RepID=A0A067JSX3_JATCU|nr:hypothetical protein JCGZ_22184 [Jatropha curcas]